ncbi:MAG: molybdopterin molybdotransferase MoeA [Alphaproteobacteria bacterium]|nr:molybdopterin molybdotransferase MoeA [Alphaproteobacteria bacterium]
MTQNRLVDDCFQSAAGLMRHDEAIAHLRQRTRPIVAPEEVPLDNAGGRILAASVSANHDVPAYANAAVDGYAYRYSDIAQQAETRLSIAGRAAAGQPFAGDVARGQVVRIFTGAIVPKQCDSVVMQEDVSPHNEGAEVVLPAGLRAGANIRPAGEDVKSGQTLFESGHRLRAQDLAALASIGQGQVQCYQRLRVGIISTGDEIIPAGSRALEPGDVYDANTPMLRRLVNNAGAEAHGLGIWPDKPDLIRDRLTAAAGDFDILLTSGGASQGEEDHLAAAIDALGQRHFWQIAVKPGRPIMFGQIAQVPVIGLPGNPVAVFVCFLMYVFPVLRRLGGQPWPEPRRMYLPARFRVEKRKPGRREFWRGSLVTAPDGPGVEKYARDGSGLISSLREADGLIDMPEDIARVSPGDPVAFIPFSEFGILS